MRLAVCGMTAMLACAVPQGRQMAVQGSSAPPSVIHKTEPLYTEEARIVRVEGAVLLSAVVTQDGHTRDLKVLRSIGYGLDENAVVAIRGWRFRPAMKDGKPVDAEARIEINYRLDEKAPAWRPGPMTFGDLEGGERPTVIQAPEHPSFGYTEARTGESFTVQFEVSELGLPENVSIIKSLDVAAEKVALAALRTWRFSPAMRGGKPVRVHATMDWIRQ